MDLPPLTQQPVLHVDGTPDDNYPIRILKAYRQLCDSSWAEGTDGAKPQNLMFRLMNEQQRQRAALGLTLEESGS